MTDTNLVRRLTTILAIDVVAFSTMSARDEERALALLAARLDSAGMLVRQHRGRVFKMTGDGLLAEFASPVEAVRAALEIQEAMRSANAGAQPDDQLVLRAGINLGDVVESGDDLMGDAVNVAVRLESISIPGGICVSSSVYEQIIGKLMLGAEDIGEQRVKNIPRPIHAYRLTAGAGRPGAADHPAHAVARSMPRTRRFLVAGVLAILILGALAGTFYLRHPSAAALPADGRAHLCPAGCDRADTGHRRHGSRTPRDDAGPHHRRPRPLGSPPQSSPAPRRFAAKEVPFVPDFHWRALQNYADAPGAKAFALNVRGIFAMAVDRFDEAAARRTALEDCNRKVERDVPIVRAYDGCTLYGCRETTWSGRSAPRPCRRRPMCLRRSPHRR